MKVNFGSYTFFDSASKDKNTYNAASNKSYQQYSFNEKIFNDMLNNRQYEDAANYASQFHFNDPRVQKQHENDIINLRRSGRMLAAIYGRVEDPEDLKKIEFYDSVFTDGGAERLTNNKDNPNSYADALAEAKKLIGASIESKKVDFPLVTNDGKKHVAEFESGLSPEYKEHDIVGVTFKPEKRYGLFGIDWLAKDNPYNIDRFYEDSGLTEADLREAGVQIINKDGKTELRFHKSNSLANTILYNIPTSGIRGEMNLSHNFDLPKVVGYDEKGNAVGYNQGLTRFKEIIDSAKAVKDKYFEKLNLEEKDYSSTASPWISDALMELQNMGLSDEEYNRRAKMVAPEIFNAVNSLGSANYEMYSNYENDKDTDETLIKLDNDVRSEVINMISGTAPKDMQIDAMVSNGKIGALVTLNEKRNKDNKVIQKRIQVFIPGLLQEQAQARINRDSSTRAIQELNSMLDWGYDYKLDNGSKISISPKGKFQKDEKEITKEEAIREINKDIILTDSMTQLKYDFMNSNGEIINEDQYELMARRIALSTAAELYNNDVKLADITGENYIIHGHNYSASDIFNQKIDKDNTQYETWDIIEDIYSMYNRIMADLIYYK